MTDRNTPIRSVLEDGYSEQDVQRIWLAVESRTARRPLERRVRGMSWAAACAVVVVLALYLGRGFVAGPVSGPLELASGGMPSGWTVPRQAATETVTLKDGSRLFLEPGTRLEVVNNDSATFYSLLLNGKSTFDVRPQGSRRWLVECGLATVEVVGTKFSCELRPGGLTVAVERGVVLVRGERVPHRVKRMVAGERFNVVASPGESSSNTPRLSAPVIPSAPSASSVSSGQLSAVAVPQSGSVSSKVRGSAGSKGSASMHSGSSSASASLRERDSVDSWLADADQARRNGDQTTAERLLERVVREFPADPRASVAAFTLARLQMAQHPEVAARSLSSALGQGLPRSLEEDALARLVEAQVRSGDREQAVRTAAQYDRRFPQGSRREDVHRWIESR